MNMRMALYRFGMFFVIFVLMRAIIVVLFLTSWSSYGQNYFKEHFGGTIGIVANIGSHVTSLGVNVKGFYTDYFYQVNGSSTFYLHHHSFGERKKFVELRNGLGVVLLGGKKSGQIDFMLDGLNHQTPYNYGIGFNYLFYHDNRGTSQQSGGFAIHAKQVTIALENDVFGGQAKDRFRTGHVQFSYRDSLFSIASGVNLWTGETANSAWDRVSFENCPSGYRSLEDLPYGRTSHGIAYASFTYSPIKYQYITAKVGVDSEHIRHAIQNRLLHDLILLPKKIERSTPHYPRLDEHGCPVFEKEQVRPAKIFLQLGVNDNWSN